MVCPPSGGKEILLKFFIVAGWGPETGLPPPERMAHPDRAINRNIARNKKNILYLAVIFNILFFSSETRIFIDSGYSYSLMLK